MIPINSYNGDKMAFDDFTGKIFGGSLGDTLTQTISGRAFGQGQFGGGTSIRGNGLSISERLASANRTDSGFLINPVVRNPVEDPLGGSINVLENLANQQVTQSTLSANTEAALVSPTAGGDSIPGITSDVDWRARLRPKGGNSSNFWRGTHGSSAGDTNQTVDPLLRPLQAAGGLVWQYTPNIFVTGRANYNAAEFYGSNYPFVTYTNTTPPVLTITADFTANTTTEARYLLALFHFVRVATKSFYGDAAVADGMYGTPPPVMLFEYMGDHGFNKVPVVLTDYQYSLQDDVDYVPVKTGVNGDETTYVPTFTNVALTLQPSYTPHKLRKRFDLNAFTTGTNYKDGFI